MTRTRSADALGGASRYELLERIASGGMATVYIGRIRGAAGFSRLVAIKRAHPHLIEDPTFRRMLIAEARLASRIHHPHVVSVQDVEESDDELLLVMDYVDGVAMSRLLSLAITEERPMPPPVAVRIVVDVCTGLHAAHELRDSDGTALGIVHRDVSPHNILVGLDGISRIADFGVAKCVESTTATRSGALKGKAGYMAPEYIESRQMDARGDVFALAVVLWEALANRRLFRADDDSDTLHRVMRMQAPPVSSVAPSLGPSLDAVIARGLAKSPSDRFATARQLGDTLEATARQAGLLASYADVGAHVDALAGARLARLRAQVQEKLQLPADDPSTPSLPNDAEETQTRPLPSAVSPSSEPSPPAISGERYRSGPSARPLARDAQLDAEVSSPTDTVSLGPAREVAPVTRHPGRARRVMLAAFLTGAVGAGGAFLFTGLGSGSSRSEDAPAAEHEAQPEPPAASSTAPDPPATTAAEAPAPASAASTAEPLPATSSAAERSAPGSRTPTPARAAPRTPAAARAASPVEPSSAPSPDKAPPNPYAPR